MHFTHSESRLSMIEPNCEENNNDSIINQLNLLQTGFESKVVKIESFLYTQEAMTPQTPQQKMHDSFLRDFEGNVIPAISSRQLSPYNLIGLQSNLTARNDYLQSNRVASSKGEEKKQQKKSIRQEIMQENLLLERRLSLNKQYIPSFPSARHYIPPKQFNTAKEIPIDPAQKKNEATSTGKLDQAIMRLQEQYNRSKVVKLYNFILKQVPKCSRCDGLRIHLTKEANNVALKCKECEQGNAYHPLMGVLYDLQNKGRFEEEVAVFQNALDSIATELTALQEQARSLQSFRDKVVNLKNLNRKRYKEINQSKFFLRKHLGNLQQSHLLEFQHLLPKQYLQQLQLWSEIRQQHGKWLQGSAGQLCRIMPAHLLEPASTSRLISSLHRLLNYEKEQAVKISVSEGIKFPIKKMENAVFVVDGSYSLPVFEDVKHLQLEFQNKKTQRELSLLFSNFPRQVHSLSFAYNHKIHSHISAQTFPFLRFLTALPLQKLHVTIQNVKDFTDVLEMANVMTPKSELRITVTKHIFSKAALNLPQSYYQTLVGKLGSQITRIQLDLPESVDSPAVLNYEQLLSLKCLISLKVQRGEKNSKDLKKAKVLQSLQSSQDERNKELIMKRAISTRINYMRAIKKLSNTFSRQAINAVLMCLL